MLKKLRIKNFQSHTRTEIDFCSGVNGIIGTSQAGKTAILRAIKLLRTNRPLGFRFHTKYTKASKTSVQAIFSDDVVASINKSKNNTIYKLKNHSGRKVSFSKVGKGVPDVVSQGINLSDINVHSQLDAPFMIASTSGEIAREINKVTNSEMVDAWTQGINKKITSLGIQKDILKNDIKSIKNQLLNLKGVALINSLVTELECIIKKRGSKQETHFLLTEIEENIKKEKDKILFYQKHEGVKSVIQQAEKVRKKIKKKECVIVLLGKLIREKDRLLILSQDYKEIACKYIDKIKSKKKCPICLSLIQNKDIKRIENEIHLGVGRTRNK